MKWAPTLTKFFTVVASIFFWAGELSASTIICHSYRHEYQVEIIDAQSFRVEEGTERKGDHLRDLASVERQLKEGAPLSLTLKERSKGNIFNLQIGSVGHFNELNDFLEVKNSLGHSISYSLRCHLRDQK